eukprot:1195019-Prorocentrum_minimum.AAC.5
MILLRFTGPPVPLIGLIYVVVDTIYCSTCNTTTYVCPQYACRLHTHTLSVPHAESTERQLCSSRSSNDPWTKDNLLSKPLSLVQRLLETPNEQSRRSLLSPGGADHVRVCRTRVLRIKGRTITPKREAAARSTNSAGSSPKEVITGYSSSLQPVTTPSSRMRCSTAPTAAVRVSVVRSSGEVSTTSSPSGVVSRWKTSGNWQSRSAKLVWELHMCHSSVQCTGAGVTYVSHVSSEFGYTHRSSGGTRTWQSPGRRFPGENITETLLQGVHTSSIEQTSRITTRNLFGNPKSKSVCLRCLRNNIIFSCTIFKHPSAKPLVVTTLTSSTLHSCILCITPASEAGDQVRALDAIGAGVVDADIF